jgi:predicted phage-related endonuclease
MSITTTETFIQLAKQQHSQIDINASLIRAIIELVREMKEMENQIQSLRRNIQMSRRF